MRRLLVVAVVFTLPVLCSSCGGNQEGHDTGGMHRIAQEDRWGYIDKIGTVVVQPQFDGAEPFSEGLAAVKVGGSYG